MIMESAPLSRSPLIAPNFSSILLCIRGQDNVSWGMLRAQPPIKTSSSWAVPVSAQSWQLKLINKFFDMEFGTKSLANVSIL